MSLVNRPSEVFRLPARLVLLTAALLCLLGSRSAHAAVRLLSSDPGGVTAEFTLDGFRVDTVTVGGVRYSRLHFADGAVLDGGGLPELPGLGSLLGIPRRAQCTIRVVSTDALEMAALPPQPIETQHMQGGKVPEPVSERVADAGAYRRAGLWPAQPATLGPAMILRLQRVQPFGVRPVRYDASRGMLWVARRIVVRVDFGGASNAPSPGEGLAPESRTQESLYKNAILNYDQARSFRRMRGAAPSAPRAIARPQGPEAADFPDFKLRVDTTGIRSVTFEQLQAKSPSLRKILSALVRCWEKLPAADPRLGAMVESEVPIRVLDNDGDGFFGPGDQVVFYGLNLADRLHAKWFDAENTSRYYTDGEVYWLGERTPPSGGWARMAQGGASGLSGAYTPVAYRSVTHREENTFRQQEPDILDQEVYFFTDLIFEDTLAFNAFDVDPARPIDFRVAFRGGKSLAEGEIGTHILAMDVVRPQGSGVVSDPVTPSYTFSGKGEGIFSSGPILSGASLASRNVLHILGTHPPGDGNVAGSGAWLEWFDVGAYRKFRAPQAQSRFYFTSGDTLGNVALKAANFTDSLVDVFDFTDPRNPRWIETAGHRTKFGLRWTIDFQDTCTAAHSYFASSRAALPALADDEVAADTVSSLATMTGGDMIIITHESLESQAQALAAEHASQGLSVQVARVGDVYDEFDGGRKSDVAIKRFLRKAFYTWNPIPRYVLLFGESSENPKGHLIRLSISTDPSVYSHADLVPSPRAYGSVPIGITYEAIPEDHFFAVGLDTTETFPILPAMSVGRLSVATSDQAGDVVQKIIRYEHPVPGEAWRSRNLYVADDTWSNGLLVGSSNLGYNSSESVFEEVSRKLMKVVSDTAHFAYFGADTFFLHQYTDSIHACDVPGTGGSQRDWTCMTDQGQQHIGPALWRKMTSGDLIVNYQGHGNQRLWAHEYILVNDGQIGHNIDQIGNVDRPFVVMSFACHVNKYDDFREFDGRLGDGLGEQFVYTARKGAIASFASTGYEWLPSSGENLDLDVLMYRSFFVNPPEPDFAGSSGQRWILGDVLSDAKTRFVTTFLSGLTFPGNYWCGYDCKPPSIGGSRNIYEAYSYCLLGDPALHMSAGDANFQLAQDGQPLGDQGYFLTSGPDSVTLSANAMTPTGMDSVWVEEHPKAGGVRSVDRARYSVTPTRDVGSVHPRGFALAYKTVPAFEDYTIDFKARDLRGLISTASVHRVLDLAALTSDRGQLDTTHTLPPSMTIHTVLTSSSPVDSSVFTFDVNGQVIAPTSVSTTRDAALEGGLRHYNASLLHEFSPGTSTVGFTATGPGGVGSVRKIARVRVAAAGDFSLSEVINYPNPFEGTTGFHYNITQSVDRLKVRIYTISGRLLRELTDPDVGGGTHFLAWDGTDADGDPIANGTYIYKVVAELGTKKLEKIGTLVRVRR